MEKKEISGRKQFFPRKSCEFGMYYDDEDVCDYDDDTCRVCNGSCSALVRKDDKLVVVNCARCTRPLSIKDKNEK